MSEEKGPVVEEQHGQPQAAGANGGLTEEEVRETIEAQEATEVTPIGREAADAVPRADGSPVVEPEAEDAPVVEEAAAEAAPVVEVAASAEAEAEEEDEDADDDKPAPLIPVIEPHRAALPWYVVHTYSGYEMRVKKTLEERIKKEDLYDKFGNILVPQETVVELVRGQKKTSTRKFFPGYILVQIDMDDETWHLVKATPKVTGFIGDSNQPLPLTAEEVAQLTQQIEGGAARPRPSVQFEQGDPIKVIDGPFADFNGTVDEVKPDKGKLRVLISIFGRNTPVELDFVQVEKA